MHPWSEESPQEMLGTVHWALNDSSSRHWKLDVLFYRLREWVAFGTTGLWIVLLVCSFLGYKHFQEKPATVCWTDSYSPYYCFSEVPKLWYGRGLQDYGQMCVSWVYVWVRSEWGPLCHISYWKRGTKIAVLKNTAICASGSIIVIRHGTWLTELPPESAGKGRNQEK